MGIAIWEATNADRSLAAILLELVYLLKIYKIKKFNDRISKQLRVPLVTVDRDFWLLEPNYKLRLRRATALQHVLVARHRLRRSLRGHFSFSSAGRRL